MRRTLCDEKVKIVVLMRKRKRKVEVAWKLRV